MPRTPHRMPHVPTCMIQHTQQRRHTAPRTMMTMRSLRGWGFAPSARRRRDDSSTGRRAAPFLDATDLAMQTAVELHHLVPGRLDCMLRQRKNLFRAVFCGGSLGLRHVLGRAGGQGLSIRISVYGSDVRFRKARGRVGSVSHGEREPARQRQNYSGEDSAAAAATRGGQ